MTLRKLSDNKERPSCGVMRVSSPKSHFANCRYDMIHPDYSMIPQINYYVMKWRNVFSKRWGG